MSVSYDYKCVECGHVQEAHFTTRLKRTITKRCPKCFGRAERVYHAPAVKYSGSGWTRKLQEPDDEL